MKENMKHDDRSGLRRALCRVGGRLDDVTNVEGIFMPRPAGIEGTRLYGMLVAKDASVLVGFDALRVEMPGQGPFPVRLSGRPWLDERTGQVTIMVRSYTRLDRVEFPTSETHQGS